jgi:hypothetical protein
MRCPQTREAKHKIVKVYDGQNVDSTAYDEVLKIFKKVSVEVDVAVLTS